MTTTQAIAGRLARLTPARGGRLLGFDLRRLLRAALTGAVCALAQLGLLELFIVAGREPALANTVAFLLSAQLNFGLSLLFIWGDRALQGRPPRRVVARWLAFPRFGTDGRRPELRSFPGRAPQRAAFTGR